VIELKIYFVTGNRNKFREGASILKKYGVVLKMYRTDKVEIQSNSLRQIVKYALQSLNLDKPFIVEDAGLFIKSLNGFPGPYSKYVYKTIGLNGILKLMQNILNREAYFKSVIGYCEPNGLIKFFEGRVYGYISYKIRGKYGFGYDPIFIPSGLDKTFGEMPMYLKNKYSHRSRAFRKLGKWLRDRS